MRWWFREAITMPWCGNPHEPMKKRVQPNIGYEAPMVFVLHCSGWRCSSPSAEPAPPPPSGQRSPARRSKANSRAANATFKSGQELPREGIFSLVLPAGRDGGLSGGLAACEGDAGYGGVITLRKLWTGRYSPLPVEPAELELIQNYSSLSLGDVAASRRATFVSIGEGTVVLQVRGVASVAVIVHRVPQDLALVPARR